MSEAKTIGYPATLSDFSIQDLEEAAVFELDPKQAHKLDARRAIERYQERKALERNISEYWFD